MALIILMEANEKYLTVIENFYMLHISNVVLGVKSLQLILVYFMVVRCLGAI